MNIKIIAIGLLAISATGCKKFLEVPPETQLSSANFFSTESDFQQAVNATYVPLRAIYNGPAWMLGEMHSDNTYYARNILFGATEQTENIADFSIPTANGITTNTNILNQYRQDYQIIARANQVLSTIDNVEFAQESKDNLRGQALFLRAFAYFELVRYFGEVPLHLTPVTNRQEAALPLASTDTVYAQIIQDVQEAASLLPSKAEQEPGRATSGAAKTLLANVYVVRQEWAAAETVLKDIVANEGYSLMPTYEEAFSNTNSNKNNQESVFEVQFQEGPAGLNGNFMYAFLPRPISAEELAPITGTSNPQSLSEEGNNIPTPDIIAAYEPNDQRKDASIAYVTLNSSLRGEKLYPYIKKYAKPHAVHLNTGNNWPVYRYSEVLLFLAEALNEQGKGGEAKPYLDQVRVRAGLLPTTATDLRQAIWQERRVELAFENKRWFDLVRTGRVQEVIGAYGQRVIANPQDYYYPAGAVPPNNAFTVLDTEYGMPAAEADLSPHF